MPVDADVNVVIGASGSLGKAVVHELVRQGKPVRAVSRSGKATLPDSVGVQLADVSDTGMARRICDGARVVYLCANPSYQHWILQLPRIMTAVIDAAGRSGARLVFGDNLYMYGPVGVPMREDLPSNAEGPKGRVRAEIAQMLLHAHRAGKVRATIGRASDFFGPGVVNALMGERVFRPALAGGTVWIAGNPDVPHTYSYIEDVARALVTLGDRTEALGEVWHTPNPETVTTRRFLEMIFEKAGQRPKIRSARRWLVKTMGLFSRQMQEMEEVLYQFERPFVVDHSKYGRTFGADATPLAEAIRRTLDWCRTHPPAT